MRREEPKKPEIVPISGENKFSTKFLFSIEFNSLMADPELMQL